MLQSDQAKVDDNTGGGGYFTLCYICTWSSLFLIASMLSSSNIDGCSSKVSFGAYWIWLTTILSFELSFSEEIYSLSIIVSLNLLEIYVFGFGFYFRFRCFNWSNSLFFMTSSLSDLMYIVLSLSYVEIYSYLGIR